MIINKEYFQSDELKFRGIRKETLKYIDVFETYSKANIKFTCKFEDFMATLGSYLNRSGYSIRKIEKWYKQINKNIQSLAKGVLNKTYEKENN